MVHKAYLPFSDPESSLWLHVSLTKFTAFHCPLRLLWSTRGRKMISGNQDPHCAKLSRSQSTARIIYMQYQLCDLYLWDRNHIDIYHLGLPFVPHLLGIKMGSDRNVCTRDVDCLTTYILSRISEEQCWITQHLIKSAYLMNYQNKSYPMQASGSLWNLGWNIHIASILTRAKIMLSTTFSL